MQEFAPCKQLHHPLHGKGAGSHEGDMDSGEWAAPNERDAALLFVAYLYLGHVASADSNNTFTLPRKAEPGLFSTLCMQTNCQQSSIPSIFRGSCACRMTSFTPGKIVIGVDTVTPEMSNTDVRVAKALLASGHFS